MGQLIKNLPSGGPASVRSLLTAQAVTAGSNTRGYFFGGWDLSSTYADCEEYDPVGQAWESKTDMPAVNRYQVSAQIGGNTAYLVGGALDGNACWEFAMPELPVVTNLSPAHEQTDVPVDSNVQFDIIALIFTHILQQRQKLPA